MKLYQGTQTTVNGSIAIVDAEAIAARASEGLLALSMDIGLEVVRQMLEADVTELACPKGVHQKDRSAYRHDKKKSRVVMGGQKVSIERPRVCSVDGMELADAEPVSTGGSAEPSTAVPIAVRDIGPKICPDGRRHDGQCQLPEQERNQPTLRGGVGRADGSLLPTSD